MQGTTRTCSLQRAFADIKDGFYVDVGGLLPRADSNTYALYLQGWRGIVVEPLAWIYPEFKQAWHNDRPRDDLVAAMAADENGMRLFWTCNARQMSTGSRSLLQQWQAGGSTIAEPANVPCLPPRPHLPADQEVQLLSIDVEGMEEEVLAGLDLDKQRPWLDHSGNDEARARKSQSPTNIGSIPLAHGYYMVYKDGVNCWFLAREHIGLAEQAALPAEQLGRVDDRAAGRTGKSILGESLKGENHDYQTASRARSVGKSRVKRGSRNRQKAASQEAASQDAAQEKDQGDNSDKLQADPAKCRLRHLGNKDLVDALEAFVRAVK